MPTITERVAAGAAFLDEHDPGWWRGDVERAIDLHTLQLSQGDYCVLGQRCPLETLADYIGTTDEDELWGQKYQSFDAHALQLSGLDLADLGPWAGPLGFTETANFEWDDLTDEWKRVITERRVAA